MGTVRDHSDDRPLSKRVLESNEDRLDAFDRQGVRLIVDGPTALQFFFDRVLASPTPHQFQLDWVLNVARLLNQVETQARTQATAVGA